MSEQYDAYLSKHKKAVNDACKWLMKNDILPANIFRKHNTNLKINIPLHDNSKYSPYEYDAYDDYFYGERTKKVEEDFNRAWLHHIHENPHHWQHWVLINDDGAEMIPLEMPPCYVAEMICDWWSFSWTKGNPLEIFDWYDEHKDQMILHGKTRALVEEILDRIKQKLDGGNSDVAEIIAQERGGDV